MSEATTLTASETKRAIRHGIFTVTSETRHGYYVTCLRLDDGAPLRLGQSKECVRPSTARRYATKLVREALRSRR
jgi:hypothetical protein